MTRLFAGSIRTYLQAEQDSGQSVGFHQTGSLRLATTPKERELFHQYEAMYQSLDIPYQVVDNEDIAALNPCVDINGLYGAAHTPTDGHVDPVGATNAVASAARAKGAVIKRHCPVHDLQRDGNIWILNTETGPIRAQHVVMAASFWTRELLLALGINTPLYATEHHEFITGSIAKLEAMDHEVPAIRDSDVSCSVRQEAKGVLFGIYETEPVFWSLDGIPKDFKEELLPPNTDRLTPHLEKLMQRMPAIADAGIKTINNGPMCWTPDGLPLLGPLAEHPGLWMASGFNVGIGTGGGSAEFLAHWMTQRKPPYELNAVHADRFGNDMSRDAAVESIKACYRRGYKLPDKIL